MKEFANVEWLRALKALESGKLLLKTDPDSAASRAYYAVFHAITAYFALQNKTFKKHTQLRSTVHKELINTGLWPKEFGQYYDFLLDLRETGDYGGLSRVSIDDAMMSISKAVDIIEMIKKSCSDFIDHNKMQNKT